MKRPEHPMLVALVESYARGIGVPPADLWAYLDRKKAPPPDVRAALVDAFFPAVRPDDFLLPSTRENDTLDTMDATEISEPRRGRPLTNQKHPFVAAMVKDGLTVAEIAVALKRSPSTVKSWYKADGDSGRRPIPRDVAKALAKGIMIGTKRFRVPASAWARIAD